MTLYYKMPPILLQNVTAVLLQNATEVYYKMRRLLQITTVHWSIIGFITRVRFFIHWCYIR